MSDERATFSVVIPGPDEPGFIGFLDELYTCLEILEGAQMSLDGWKTVKGMLFSRIDMPDAEIRAMFRQWTREQYVQAIVQILEASDSEKKE